MIVLSRRRPIGLTFLKGFNMKDLGLSKMSIEVVKDYWDSRPCNIRHSTLEIGTKEYFDEVEQRKYFVEPHIPGFANFSQWKNRTVLEIGCGIGTDAINFARAGANYTGIDLSENSIKICRDRFKVFNLLGEVFQTDFENLPPNLTEKKFNLVYSFGVIHHSPNPRLIIENVRKVISDSGEFRFMVYAKNSWKSIMIQHGLDQPEAQYGCPIAFSFDENDVLGLLKDQFEIISISKDHIFPYQVEKYKQYKYEKEDWFKNMPSMMFNALEKSLGWHLLVTARPI